MAGHGTFIWNELYTDDPNKACDFYGSLLGWHFDEIPGPDGVYRIAKLGDRPVAGLFEMKGKDFDGVPPHWLAYIEVDEIDKRVAAAKRAGAQMIREPFDVEGVGRIAIFKDAVGALIAWMTPAFDTNADERS
jgi:predicted enzyme related to lactoylglutathione lyase